MPQLFRYRFVNSGNILCYNFRCDSHCVCIVTNRDLLESASKQSPIHKVQWIEFIKQCRVIYADRMFTGSYTWNSSIGERNGNSKDDLNVKNRPESNRCTTSNLPHEVFDYIECFRFFIFTLNFSIDFHIMMNNITTSTRYAAKETVCGNRYFFISFSIQSSKWFRRSSSYDGDLITSM